MTLRVALLLTGLLVLSGGARAALDDVQLQLLQQLDTPLRFDNVEGAPYWLAGPRPRRHRGAGMHVVRLQPGETVSLRLTDAALLRLHAVEGELRGGDLALGLSNGTGLAVMLEPPAPAGQWLVKADQPSWRVAHIQRPAWHDEAIEVALFVARYDYFGAIAPHRNVLPLPVDAVSLRRDRHATPRRFWPMTPDEPLTLTVRGPARYQLEHRYVYHEHDGQTLQAYRLQSWLDDEPWQTLAFETGPERREPVWRNTGALVVGRREYGYIDIPDGEFRLTLRSDAPLYMRVLAQQQPDYLLPGHNAPELEALAIRRNLALAQPRTAIDRGWDVDQSTLNTPSVWLDQARVLAHNNLRRDGPLVGAALLAHLAAERPDAPELATQAEGLLARHGYYRHLLPLEKHGDHTQRVAWFATPRPVPLLSGEVDVMMARQHSASVSGRLAKGLFSDIRADESRARRFPVPKRDGPTRLRVVVAGQSDEAPAQLFIQFDQQPPKRLRLEPGWRVEGMPGDGEVAATVWGRTHGGHRHPTLGGPFALHQSPAPLIDAHAVELVLPQSVGQIRVWRDGGEVPLALALQYRTGAQFKLTEAQYLRAAPPPAEFDAAGFLQRLDRAGDGDWPRVNDWRGLARRLYSQRDQFTASVMPPRPPGPARHTPDQQRLLARQARLHSQRGQWLLALERWSALLHGGAGAWRGEALAAQVTALERLGEGHQARMRLKGLLLYDPDSVTRTMAFERLREFYRGHHSDGALLALYATVLLREPTADLVAGYAELLLGHDHAREALLLLLELPAARRSPELLLRAAYRAGWWRLFERTLAALPDGEPRNVWAGYRAQWRGDYKAANKLWRRGGARGRALADALMSGWEIQRGLVSDHEATRRDALASWPAWRTALPGPRVWRTEAGLVLDHAGAVSSHVVARDLTALGYRATPQRPLRVGVVGPARLRFEARPLHAGDAEQPLDGWLKLSDGDVQRVLPVLANTPATGLELVGLADRVPGNQVVMEYDVGPGWHEIEMRADAFDLWVAPKVSRPQLPLAVLPPMTADTVAAVELNRFDGRDSRRLACHRLGFALRVQRCRYRNGRVPLSLVDRVPPAWLDYGHAPFRLMPHGGIDPTAAVPELTVDMTTLQAQARLTALLWQAEARPESPARFIADAERLVHAHPDAAGAKAMLARLSRRAGWMTLSSVGHSAGLRQLDMAGWQPESRAGRVRKALLGITDPDAHVVSGTSQLGLAMVNLQPATLALSLTMVDLPHLPAHALTVSVQLDNAPPQFVTLHTVGTVVGLPLEVPAGSHALRIGIVAPVANQYVMARLTEISPAGAVLARSGRRAYHVATVDEPVELWLEGPAWLRVDERLPAGDVISDYRYVDAGWQQLTLPPSPGRDESLLRIHRRVIVPDRQPVAPRPRLAVAPQAVPGSLLRVADRPDYRWLNPVDELPLGEQEDGTWSFSAALSNRQSDSEGGNNRAFTERFLQLGAAYRYFDEADHSYWKGELLGRLREEGGPVFGVLGGWDYVPPRAAWRATASASVYAQNPGPDGTLEWATTLRGRLSQRRDIDPKTFHRPYVEVFKRWLSLDDTHGYDDRRVDRDVYTDYKAAHRHGLTLGDRLIHEPWLDTQWYGELSLTTNEAFNPLRGDFVRARVGWRQLMRQWLLNAEYDYRHFFDDQDRDAAVDRNRLNLGLEWNDWHSWQRRWQARLTWRYDLEPGANTLLLQLRWHGGKGRGLRDFRPSEIAFRQLRRRHIPAEPNNAVTEEAGDG